MIWWFFITWTFVTQALTWNILSITWLPCSIGGSCRLTRPPKCTAGTAWPAGSDGGGAVGTPADATRGTAATTTRTTENATSKRPPPRRPADITCGISRGPTGIASAPSVCDIARGRVKPIRRRLPRPPSEMIACASVSVRSRVVLVHASNAVVFRAGGDRPGVVASKTCLRTEWPACCYRCRRRSE